MQERYTGLLKSISLGERYFALLIGILFLLVGIAGFILHGRSGESFRLWWKDKSRTGIGLESTHRGWKSNPTLTCSHLNRAASLV